MEFIRPWPGHDVDGTTRELAVLDIERCKFHRRGLDRVVRNRKRETRRGTGSFVQSKAVDRQGAVDRKGIRTRGAAQTVDARTGAIVCPAQADTRIDTDHVTDLARNAGHRFYILKENAVPGPIARSIPETCEDAVTMTLLDHTDFEWDI